MQHYSWYLGGPVPQVQGEVPGQIMEAVDACFDALNGIGGAYHRLVLLVGRQSSLLSNCMYDLSIHLGLPVVNLNAELAAALLEVPIRQRQIRANKAVGDIIDSVPSNTVLLDHTDILFSTSLRLDPLALLKSLSRNKTVVAAWPGAVRGKLLLHGEEWHPEFVSYPSDEVKAISVEPTGV